MHSSLRWFVSLGYTALLIPSLGFVSLILWLVGAYGVATNVLLLFAVSAAIPLSIACFFSLHEIVLVIRQPARATRDAVRSGFAGEPEHIAYAWISSLVILGITPQLVLEERIITMLRVSLIPSLVLPVLVLLAILVRRDR